MCADVCLTVMRHTLGKPILSPQWHQPLASLQFLLFIPFVRNFPQRLCKSQPKFQAEPQPPCRPTQRDNVFFFFWCSLRWTLKGVLTSGNYCSAGQRALGLRSTASKYFNELKGSLMKGRFAAWNRHRDMFGLPLVPGGNLTQQRAAVMSSNINYQPFLLRGRWQANPPPPPDAVLICSLGRNGRMIQSDGDGGTFSQSCVVTLGTVITLQPHLRV